MPPRLDELAERLGVAVDVLEQLVARGAPTREAAVERADVDVAERSERRRRLVDEALAVVVQHDRYVATRQPRLGF